MKTFGFPAASAVSFVLLLASCSPPFGESATHELVVAIPPAPAAWAFLPELRMRLSWMEPGGSLRSLLAEPGSRHEIKVRRGSPQAIVALPISSGRSLCPAGALYPEGLAGRKAGEGMDELSLDWRGGYAASLFAALEGGGVDPCGFDLYALVDQAIARSSDPWLLAPLEVARRLTASGFRIDAFKKPKLMAVDLVPGRSWAPESPFAAAPVPLRSAAAEIAQLPEGLWRFVGEDSELFVSVDSSGRATFVRR